MAVRQAHSLWHMNTHLYVWKIICTLAEFLISHIYSSAINHSNSDYSPNTSFFAPWTFTFSPHWKFITVELPWNLPASHNTLPPVHLLQHRKSKITLVQLIRHKNSLAAGAAQASGTPGISSLWVTLQCISSKWARCVEIFKSLLKPPGISEIFFHL